MFPLNSIAILINDTTRLWEAVRLLAKSWTCSWHLNGSAFSLSLLLGEICHYHQVKSSRIEFNWQTTLGVCRDPTTMEKKKKNSTLMSKMKIWAYCEEKNYRDLVCLLSIHLLGYVSADRMCPQEFSTCKGTASFYHWSLQAKLARSFN